jgi:hypothetical protein
MTEYEMTRKFVESGTYVDLCNKCFYSSDFPPTKDRPDLLKTEDVEDDGDGDICEASSLPPMREQGQSSEV